MRAAEPGLDGLRWPPLIAAAVLLLAVATGACLPASIRTTPTPQPTPTPTPTATPSPTPTPQPTPTPTPGFVEYKVKRGDTLLTIAKRFKTTGRSIAYWNRERYPSLDPETAGYSPDRIQIGWVLRILPGQEYLPPPDDGETGIEVTPSPDDSEDYESIPPSVAP